MRQRQRQRFIHHYVETFKVLQIPEDKTVTHLTC